jgi:isopenicillin-N N-acyltransferase-like protein
MSKTPKVKVLALEGSAEEIGQAHGRELRPIIQKGINRWKHALQKMTGVNPADYIHRFIEDTNLVAAAKKWTPRLQTEVEGIGQGADVDFDAIFAWQCIDEEWWYRFFEKRHGIEALGLKKCSGLGCFDGKASIPLLAQNLDLPNYYDGLQTLLHIKHPRSPLELIVFTAAGMIGLNGLNNQPLGLCVNTLLELASSKDGLPVAFVTRGILEQPTLDKAIDFIKKVKHASGQNYILGDAQKIVDFECSANKVSQYVPTEGDRRICHANHAFANDEKRQSPEKIINWFAPTTRARFDSIERQLKDTSKRISVEDIKSILSSHEAPICVHKTKDCGEPFTFGSLVISLSKSPTLYLTSEPPCANEWKQYKF